jgi:hypothetical protein
MTLSLGTVPSGTTIYIPFASYGADGQSLTLTGLAATDIEIYKDGSVTQRASDAGYALLDTDGIDFDAITGIHGFSIDLNNNTDAGFFAVGSWYWVVVSAVTVNTQTVNFIAAVFRIGAAEHTAGYPVATIKDGTGTGEIDTTSGGVLVAAIAANAITATAINADAITAAKIADGAIDAATFAAGAINAAAIAADAIGASELAADAVAEIADAIWDEAQAGHVGSGTFGEIATEIAEILTDTGTTLQGELDGIQADTEDIQTRLPAALVSGRIDASVGAMAANVLTAAATAADFSAEVADQVWDEALAGHLGVGSTGEQLNAAGAAGDPWATALPGAYGAGTAGKIVGDNVNATISSRATQTSVDDLPTNAELATALGTADDAVLAAVAALNNLSVAQVNAEVDAALADYDPPTRAELTTDTNSILTAVGDVPTNAELATALAAADDAVLAAIAALNDLSAADVNAEVVDALATDTYAEPGQGAPPATASLSTKLSYLYKLTRNKVTQDDTTFSVFADDATTVDHKATVSDAAGVFTRGELATGP